MMERTWSRWHLVDAEPKDVPATVESLVLAFEGDPHMAFLFPAPPEDRRRLVAEFFEILLTLRLQLGAPVKVIRPDDRARGVVMGYSTSRPAWPAEWQNRWAALQASCEGGSRRFEESDAASALFEPPGPHYYLGVVGVHPSLRGLGAGAALVRTFCGLSDGDPKSRGTFIETCNPANVAFYQRCGFVLRGQHPLDETTTMYCLFKKRPTD